MRLETLQLVRIHAYSMMAAKSSSTGKAGKDKEDHHRRQMVILLRDALWPGDSAFTVINPRGTGGPASAQFHVFRSKILVNLMDWLYRNAMQEGYRQNPPLKVAPHSFENELASPDPKLRKTLRAIKSDVETKEFFLRRGVTEAEYNKYTSSKAKILKSMLLLLDDF